MHASYLLYLLQAALVTVAPGPEGGCPSSAQVRKAIEVHAPRLLATRPDDDPETQLTLAIGTATGTHETTLTLLDAKGRVRLFRALQPPSNDRGRDCAALADTVAFIVDRYFDEVEMPWLPEHKPPPPPAVPAPAAPPPAPPAPPTSHPTAPLPPKPVAPTATPAVPPKPPTVTTTPAVPAKPPTVTTTAAAPTKPVVAAAAEGAPAAATLPSFQLWASAGRRFPGGKEDAGGIEFRLGLDLKIGSLGHGRLPLIAEATGGIIGIAYQPVPPSGEKAKAVRSGGDLALLLAIPTRYGVLYGGPLVALEVMWLRAPVAGRIDQETHIGAAAGARAGYEYIWRDRFLLRADVTGAAAIVRQRVATKSQPEIAVFEVPPGYATLSLGAGICF